MGHELAAEVLDSFVGREAEPPRVARYRVSEAMIRNWVEALDDTNPVYVEMDAARSTGRSGIIAPPAMISTWVMSGYRRWRQVQQQRSEGVVENTAYSELMALLDSAGYTSVVATDVEQVYHHECEPGMHITARYTIESLVGPKTTALGEGYFVTLAKSYTDETERLLVSEKFRMLRFRPQETR